MTLTPELQTQLDETAALLARWIEALEASYPGITAVNYSEVVGQAWSGKRETFVASDEWITLLSRLEQAVDFE